MRTHYIYLKFYQIYLRPRREEGKKKSFEPQETRQTEVTKDLVVMVAHSATKDLGVQREKRIGR